MLPASSSITIVLATKSELYVPTETPTKRANENPFNISPPKMNSIITTNRVVMEVIKVRLKVSFRLLLTIDAKFMVL